MEVKMEMQTRQMTPRELVDQLTYLNYAHNRTISPNVTPERWEKVYGPGVWEMEEQYQRELGK